MIYKLDGKEYNVEIVRKNNKNMYLRVKDANTFLVTTSYFTNDMQVKRFLDNNNAFLRNAIEHKEKELAKNDTFYYLGKTYDIIEVSILDSISFEGSRIYVPNKKNLDKWLKNEMVRIFKERLEYNYNLFTENIPFPKLKIRNMKTRWGVCNRRDTSVTLNSNLIKEDIEKIDYVIIHELSHLVHFDHSKAFWETVSKYSPRYKQIRKEMRE